MKITMYMAMSLNGFIAGKDDDTDWISENQWTAYAEASKEFPAVIVGRATYDLMPEEEFEESAQYFVVTHDVEAKPKVSNSVFVQPDAKKVVDAIEAAGFDRALLCGGSKTNALFMRAGLVGEVIIDVEPMVIAEGKRLVEVAEGFEIGLELLETRSLNKNLVQLHYKVVKS